MARHTRLELAVLGSVAVLGLSVGLPVLADSGARALQVACVNNLKSIGTGLLAYADDYHRFLPDWGAPLFCGAVVPDEHTQPCWHTHLWTGGYVSDAARFVCPAEPDAVEALAAGEPWGLIRGTTSDLAQPGVVTYAGWETWSSWKIADVGADGQTRNIPSTDLEVNYNPVGKLSDNRLAVLYDGVQCYTLTGLTWGTAWQWCDPPIDPDERWWYSSARHEGSVMVSGTPREGDYNVLWLDGRVASYSECPSRSVANCTRGQ